MRAPRRAASRMPFSAAAWFFCASSVQRICTRPTMVFMTIENTTSNLSAMRHPGVAVCLLLLASATTTAETPLLARGASWEKVASDLKFGEGPAWHPDGYVIFEDVPNSKTLRLDAAGKVSIFRDHTSNANGQAFDREGRLLACEGNDPEHGRRLVRLEKDGGLTVLAE